MRDENKLTYINILLDSLKKKETVLRELKNETMKQASLLEADELDADAFDGTISEKQKCLDELAGLDDGFLDLYEKVKEALSSDPGAYAPEVLQAKALIKTQTELSMELEAQEEKNRQKLAIHLTNGKHKVKDFKTSSKTVAAYYKNMTNRHQEGDSYFFDRNK